MGLARRTKRQKYIKGHVHKLWDSGSLNKPSEISTNRRLRGLNREIGFGFVSCSCRACERAGEAKLRGRVREKLSRHWSLKRQDFRLRRLIWLLRFACENTRVLRALIALSRRVDCEISRVSMALIALRRRVDCENTMVLRALIALSRRVDCELTRF